MYPIQGLQFLSSKTVIFLQFSCIVILAWLCNETSAFFYDRPERALAGDFPVQKVSVRQPEEIPNNFSPQGDNFVNQNIPSEVLLTDFNQDPLDEGMYH